MNSFRTASKRYFYPLLTAALVFPWIGCQSGSDHQIHDRRTGLKIDVPANWHRATDDQLKTSGRAEAGLIGVASDPEKKAVLAVRRFAWNLMPGLSLLVTYNNLNSMEPQKRDELITALMKNYEKYLSDGKEYWELISSRHSGPSHKAYLMELVSQFSSAGKPMEWTKYIVIFPKGEDQAIEVRLSVPFMDKEKYQADFDLIVKSFQPGIEGAGQ